MSRIIINEDNTVTIEKTIVEKKCSFDSFRKVFMKDIPFVSDLLPVGTRGVGFSNNKYLVMVEIPEGKRLIRYCYTENKASGQTVDLILWFPWTYVLVAGTLSDMANDKRFCAISKVNMMFAEERIMDDNSIVGTMSLPNLAYHPETKTGSLCTGSVTIKDNSSLAGAINELIDAIFSSEFNHDQYSTDYGIDEIKNCRRCTKEIKEERENSDNEQFKLFLDSLSDEGNNYMYWWMNKSRLSSEEIKKFFILQDKTPWKEVAITTLKESRFLI